MTFLSFSHFEDTAKNARQLISDRLINATFKRAGDCYHKILIIMNIVLIL